ncbi:MAG: potassium channel family protein [Methylotetracoccus sp.]|nr:potassium channel family protein [Methylotetracoccus sp.]
MQWPKIWHKEAHYRDLLIALIALTIAYPLINAWPAGRLIEQVTLVAVLINGTLATYQHRYQIFLTLTVGAILVVGGIINFVREEPLLWLELAQLIATTLFLSHATLTLTHDIFSGRQRVSVGLLFGAVSVYLLIGMAFASAHFLLETLVTGSYHCVSPLCQGTPKSAAYVYYSFVTLATVGYGDIVPATHMAAVLANTEAIIGQMYTAILVARLVGMQITQSRS